MFCEKSEKGEKRKRESTANRIDSGTGLIPSGQKRTREQEINCPCRPCRDLQRRGWAEPRVVFDLWITHDRYGKTVTVTTGPLALASNRDVPEV